MEKLTIFGPPGTGKTTDLMNRLMLDLETTDPQKIAFVSYTKQGTYEGARRAHKRFGLKANDTPFFKTIHALCFRELGMRKDDMLQKRHYKTFSERTGIPFTGYYTQDYNSPNDEYLHVVSMEKHNPDVAFKLSKHLDAAKYEYIKTNFAAMKKQLGIKDFDDLLEDYLLYCKPFNIDIAYIDEAQDLTPLQWRVVRRMFKNAKKLTVAGDDDQSVYEWAGADTKQFLNFSTNAIVLEKSYRLPERVKQLASKVTEDIGVRKEKNFTSNGERGELVKAYGVLDIDFKGGELLLARTNYKLRELAKELEGRGLSYIRKGFNCIDNITLEAIKTYKTFSEGTTDAQALRKYGTLFHTIDRRASWQEALNKPPERVVYYDKLFESGWLDKEPIKLETFHSSKGSENDHVIVSPDLSKRVFDAYHQNRDEELRCLYVGLTRTRHKLTLLLPSNSFYYPVKYFND